MEKVVPNSKFVGHSTEIIRQSKIKGTLTLLMTNFLGYKTLFLGPKGFDCSKALKIALCLFVLHTTCYLLLWMCLW